MSIPILARTIHVRGKTSSSEAFYAAYDSKLLFAQMPFNLMKCPSSSCTSNTAVYQSRLNFTVETTDDKEKNVALTRSLQHLAQ